MIDTAGMLAELARRGKRVPAETELDRFASYVAAGAVITQAHAFGVSAEGGESERWYNPTGGLTEAVYCLAGDDDERSLLARGILEGELVRRGHECRTVGITLERFDCDDLRDLVEDHSFEAVADAIEPMLVEVIATEERAAGQQAGGMQEPHDASSPEELTSQLGIAVREILLPTLRQISETLDQLRLDRRNSAGRTDEADPSWSGYITIERAAEFTDISDSYLRRVIRSGELPASNIGTATRPTWRIARKDLDEWMQRRQGERPKLPPKSALDDLIRRHLPGL